MTFRLLATAGALTFAAFDISDSFAEEPQRNWETVGPLEAGISAYEEGALEVSVETLNQALEGNLSQRQTAEALYFRGLAYRELGKPGQAISDLTNAISLKNGLSKAHLKDAMRNRASAYREAGITATETVIADDPSRREGRLPISVSASRMPAPVSAGENQARPPDPPPTDLSSPSQAPPKTDGGFVAAIEKLIPDWP
jgi:tetratricopeptide (TPR) repeat protein